MELIIEFLNGFNIQTIISMGIIMWYFTKEIKTELKADIAGIRKDISDLDHDVREMNVRLSRVEGTVYGKDLYKTKE